MHILDDGYVLRRRSRVAGGDRPRLSTRRADISFRPLHFLVGPTSEQRSVRNKPNAKTKKSANMYENESEVVCKLKCVDV